MSYFNDDELEAPSWIDKEFLENILNQYEQKENVEIIKFDVTPASMKGDHYASIMFRCKVEYRFPYLANQTISLIIKTLPVEEGAKRDMLMASKVFETEIDMYSSTLPKIEKILSECGEPTKLCAKIIYHSLEPQKVIIFEDLCESGYNVIRGRYLTEDEMKQVYRKLAKIHAVSYMLGQSEDHEVVTKYQEGIFSSSAIMAMDMMKTGIINFIKMLSSHEEFAVYLEKIKAMQPDITENCKALYNAYKFSKGRENDIFVLNHGDFHMKNMMYKFDNANQLEDLIMVDYQISCYAPSNIDMIYSQYMMLSPDLRYRKNELMQYYFTEFLNILKKIGYQGVMPKYSNFQMAGLRYRHFSVFLLSTFLPMVHKVVVATMDELKDVNMSEIVENPSVIGEAYEHPDFITDMRKFLPILLSEGYLD